MGPDEDELKRRWAFNPGVRWLGTLTNAALLDALRRRRTCSCCRRGSRVFRWRCSKRWPPACVPVVSDIPSGVPEIVDAGVNGERPPVGDVRAFAAAIARLDRDRDASRR